MLIDEHEKLSSVIKQLELEIDVVTERKIRGTAGALQGRRSRSKPGRVDLERRHPDGRARERAARARSRSRCAGAGGAPRPRRRHSDGRAGAIVRLRARCRGARRKAATTWGMRLGPVSSPGCGAGCLWRRRVSSLSEGRQSLDAAVAGCDRPRRSRAYVAANFHWLTLSNCPRQLPTANSLLARPELRHCHRTSPPNAPHRSGGQSERQRKLMSHRLAGGVGAPLRGPWCCLGAGGPFDVTRRKLAQLALLPYRAGAHGTGQRQEPRADSEQDSGRPRGSGHSSLVRWPAGRGPAPSS